MSQYRGYYEERGSQDEPITTTIRVPRRVWLMLRALAEDRALRDGGRANVSATIADLAEEKSKDKARARTS